MARSSRRQYAVSAAIAVLLLAMSALPAGAAPGGRIESVTTLAPPWVRSGGQVATGVRVQVRGTVASAVAQVRILDATGKLVWSSARTRRGLSAATYDFSFAASTRELGLGTGVYLLQASVSTGGATKAAPPRHLIVVDRSVAPVPVSVIVRVSGTPIIEADGSPSGDPGGDVGTATDAQELASLAVVHPELHLTAAVPPFLLDEWAAAAPGSSVPSESVAQTAAVGADALAALRDAVSAGMPLLRAGYGEPDLSTLTTSPAEIVRQIDAGDAARAAALAPVPASGAVGSVVATGFGVASGIVPEAAAAVLATRGVSFVVANAASVSPSRAGTTEAVPYRVAVRGRSGASTTMTVLVLEHSDAALLTDPAGYDALAARLYTRAASKQGRLPVVIEVVVGALGVHTGELEKSLEALSQLPWVRLEDAPTAAATAAATTATLRARPADPTPAPVAFRDTVARARLRVTAFADAVGSSLETATADALLLAESRMWAGADGTWPLAERGLAFASKADSAAWSVLSKVSVSAPPFALPGSEGRVPVSVVNDSDRTLRVVLQASSSQMRVRDQRIPARLEPGENLLSVPVALGTASSGRLVLSVTAGGLKVASTSATVTASYLDRIVLLVGVVLVLVVLLVIIRRRMARTSRASGPSSADDDA